MIKNKLNNQCYIGQTIQNLEERWRQHKKISSNCIYLKNAFKKYGFENFNFKLICICFDKDLNKFEIDYIKKYNSLVPNGYNLTTGGKGAMYVAKVDNNMEETNNEPYKHSNETKAKIKYRLKAILASDEKKKERSDKTRIQHMKQRLNKYKNIILDDNLTKYIFPIIKKGTNITYKYEVRIDNIITSFYDGKTEPTILYQNALNFLNELKNQNNIIDV
jgi:group I intron endonuclease